MPVDLPPTILLALPRTNIQAGRDRLLRWFATAVTALTAAIAILAAAMAAVVLGIT